MPVIYPDRQYADAGGLMTYGSNVPDQYRQAGINVGAFSRARSQPISR
jgi:putative ABC transport system substrate-binding protein